MKYRKIPVVIHARQWTGDNQNQIAEFMSGSGAYFAAPYLYIPTLEGTMTAGPGDWIIQGVNGEFYPCKNDIFQKTYELA